MSINEDIPRRRPPLAEGIDRSNAQIASKLRALYQSVQDEVLPDRFMDLLEKLDAAENGSKREAQE